MAETEQIRTVLVRSQLIELLKCLRAFDAAERATPRQLEVYHAKEDYWELEVEGDQARLTIYPIPIPEED